MFQISLSIPRNRSFEYPNLVRLVSNSEMRHRRVSYAPPALLCNNLWINIIWFSWELIRENCKKKRAKRNHNNYSTNDPRNIYFSSSMSTHCQCSAHIIQWATPPFSEKWIEMEWNELITFQQQIQIEHISFFLSFTYQLEKSNACTSEFVVIECVRSCASDINTNQTNFDPFSFIFLEKFSWRKQMSRFAWIPYQWMT